MEYTGHMSKRQRTNTDGHGVGTGTEEKYEDPHKPPPSRVVHVRRLNEYASESHLLEAVQNFGSVRNIVMMKSRGQALIEFEDMESAKNCVTCAQSINKIFVCGMPAFFNYSVSQEIHATGDREDIIVPPNHILLFTVINPHYPITVDVMHTICSPHGNVIRIVIFKKNGVQAMVEFTNVQEAVACKETLHGADIYSGCCTLKIEFARTNKLNVMRNDSENWDYTISMTAPTKENVMRTQALLPDPRLNMGNYGYGVAGAYNGPGPNNFTEQYESGYGGAAYGTEAFGMKATADMYNRSAVTGQQYQEAGSTGNLVLMVYGMNMQKMNCDRLFNILCLYGNVMRVKFLKSKEGSAMVQMGDAMTVERCVRLLKDVPLFNNKFQIGYSKQRYIEEVTAPFELFDGSTSYRDYSNSRNNRYLTPESASKNRCRGPTKQVHFFNAPPNVTVAELSQLFEKYQLLQPEITQFPKKTDRSSSGLFEWSNLEDAVNALVMVNHEKLIPPGEKTPYILRLCFSLSMQVKDEPLSMQDKEEVLASQRP